MRSASCLSTLLLFVVHEFVPSLSFVPSKASRCLGTLPTGGVTCRKEALVHGSSTTHRRLAYQQRPQQHRIPLWMTKDSDEDTAASENSSNKDEESTSSTDDDDVSTRTGTGSEDDISTLQQWKQKVFPPNKKTDDGFTFRQRLAKAGLSVVLSYGWVSNVATSIFVSLAWYIHCQKTRLSPLAPGQWKGFLAVYAGLYVINNIIRPARFALSVAVSTQFDKIIQYMQDKFGVSKGVAIGLTVFFTNIVGTLTLMSLGISLAALAAGVPVFPPKP